MKYYEIIDDDLKESVGTLIYYEKEKACIIELEEFLDEWTAPLLFSGLVKKGIYTIPKEISLMWVRERVIPSGRQNIGAILTNHKMKEYDEFRLLELSKGKCSQDSLRIKKISELPTYVHQRRRGNLTECAAISGNSLLCFFEDGTLKKISLSDLKNLEGVDKIENNKMLFESAKVGTGGYSVSFGDSIDISARDLYDRGIKIPLTLEDIKAFIKNAVMDTGDSCTRLSCSRQNLAYLQDKQVWTVRENVKGNLYLKGEIEKITW